MWVIKKVNIAKKIKKYKLSCPVNLWALPIIGKERGPGIFEAW